MRTFVLTSREHQTFRFIQAYLVEHGYSPLLSEIAQNLGIKSKGVIHRYVQTLQNHGLIVVHKGRHRGISLNKSEANGVDANTTLPLLGRIAAGRPIEAIPEKDNIDLSEFFMGPNRFVLKVQGESMIDAGILHGDMVIVNSTNTAKNGDIVVALIDRDEATLKFFQRNEDHSISLIPANPNMTPMRYTAQRVTIQGVVVGQMRDYSLKSR